ncbi:MAG: hypothetical protein RLZZ137_337 [Cyanobacteriota bacterium]|jgi:HEAT repeat protein
MPQALSGAAIAAVIAVCWLLGRPRPRLLSSTDVSAVAALNRGQMERLLEPASTTAQDAVVELSQLPELAGLRQPRRLDGRSRELLLRRLREAFDKGGDQRRQAISACRSWGHRATLPLLHRALRDSDPVVVAIAADAMARFRGRTNPPPAPQPLARAPRNVSRTR